MNGIMIKTLFPLSIGLAMLLTGCRSVENEAFTKLPFFTAKSDSIPGLVSPHDRKKLIQEKGEKGAKANELEKEILVAQLVYEYQTTPDPNMRREAVDALAKIPHPQRDQYLLEIVQDDNPFVRLSALEALGKTYSGQKEELTALLIDRMKSDSDKDVRISAVKILGDVTALPKSNKDAVRSRNNPDSEREIVLELSNLLHDKFPAVRYEAMGALHKVTGKDYGEDINRWLQYVRYTKGEVPDLPAERTMAEKMPTIALPMFK